MQFVPSFNNLDIWMQQNGNLYKYVAVYIEDFVSVAINPVKFTQILKDKYDFKLKETGLISFHLGCSFYSDQHGTLCMEPKST